MTSVSRSSTTIVVTRCRECDITTREVEHGGVTQGAHGAAHTHARTTGHEVVVVVTTRTVHRAGEPPDEPTPAPSDIWLDVRDLIHDTEVVLRDRGLTLNEALAMLDTGELEGTPIELDLQAIRHLRGSVGCAHDDATEPA